MKDPNGTSSKSPGRALRHPILDNLTGTSGKESIQSKAGNISANANTPTRKTLLLDFKSTQSPSLATTFTLFHLNKHNNLISSEEN